MSSRILRLVLAFSLAIPVAQTHADEPTAPQDRAPIYRAIETLKTRAADRGGFGATFVDVGNMFLGYGFIGLITGSMVQLIGGPQHRLATLSFKYAGNLMMVGLAGTGVGYMISAIAKPNDKQTKPTAADEFKSPKGMERFLNLSPEEQAQIANEDKAFGEFLKKSAEGVNNLEPK